MPNIFPDPVLRLPQADIPLPGIESHLLQGEGQQVIFMEFAQAVDLPEHAHAGQWGIVLEGKIELTIDGVTRTYIKGDRYFIPAGVTHKGKIHASYADITFFDEKDRYQSK